MVGFERIGLCHQYYNGAFDRMVLLQCYYCKSWKFGWWFPRTIWQRRFWNNSFALNIAKAEFEGFGWPSTVFQTLDVDEEVVLLFFVLVSLR